MAKQCKTCGFWGSAPCKSCGAWNEYANYTPGSVLPDSDAEDFKLYFKVAQNTAHENAQAHGWWEENREDGTLVALCHSELSELLEGLRHGNPASDKIPEFSSAEEEAADVIIRLMDMAGKREWRLAEAIVAKMKYNATRPHRHGGKAF